MAIVNRVKRLFRADVHAVLDIIEEPEAILKQAIREMQEALDWKRARLARDQRNLASLKESEAYTTEQLAKIQKDLKLCLKEGSEELAHKTVGRKLAFEKHLVAVHQRISTSEKLYQQHTQEIDLQQGQLESIVEKAKLFVPTTMEDSAFSVAESVLFSSERGGARSYPGGMRVSEEEIELEWMRIRENFAKGGAS